MRIGLQVEVGRSIGLPSRVRVTIPGMGDLIVPLYAAWKPPQESGSLDMDRALKVLYTRD